MALAKRFPVTHADVFPHGAYVVSEVTPVNDYEQSTRERKVQQKCRDTGKPLWSVDVLDADPEAKKASRTVAVKIAADAQPVPPAPGAGLPFAAVEFDGLTALPYVDQNGDFARIAWSFRATDLHAPGKKSANGGTTGSAGGAGSADGLTDASVSGRAARSGGDA